MRRLACLLAGHRWMVERFDGRGRRIQIAKCARCRRIDHSSILVTPLNRQVRRRWARDAARAVAR